MLRSSDRQIALSKPQRASAGTTPFAHQPALSVTGPRFIERRSTGARIPRCWGQNRKKRRCNQFKSTCWEKNMLKQAHFRSTTSRQHITR